MSPWADAGNNSGNYMSQFAEWYAELGLWVFPLYEAAGPGCACRRQTCRAPGKHPRTPNGFKDATNDLVQIRKWWTSWPDANIGCALGPSGLLVIDYDPRNDHDGVQLRHLTAACSEGLESAPMCRTGGGGFHAYFVSASEDDRLPTKFGHAPDKSAPFAFDIKRAGGYAVLPPSLHVTGKSYRWTAAVGAEAVKSAYALPEGLRRYVGAQCNRRTYDPTSRGSTSPGGRIPVGERNNTLFRAARGIRSNGSNLETILDALRSLNSRWEIPLDDAEVSAIARSAFACRLGDSTGDAKRSQEANVWDSPPSRPKLREAAFHGLVGDVLRVIEPRSEGDPAAILTTLLAAFGNAVGSGPHVKIGAVRHRANLFVAHVGETAQGRKGQAYRDGIHIVKVADEDWHDAALVSGLGSGEGLLSKLQDDSKRNTAGSHDLRSPCAFLYEPELARILTVASRDGSTVSMILREAWDQTRLELRVRSSPIVVRGAHVSAIAQITTEELRSRLTDREVANGFANRFMFVAVRRARLLPFGGNFNEPTVKNLIPRLSKTLDVARGIGEVSFEQIASAGYELLYAELANRVRFGLAGALLARAETHTLRLALIYALFDGSCRITAPHLEAAKAVWDYCEASARFIFGDALGDDVAQRILDEARQAYPLGLSRKDQHALFARHIGAARINAARQSLVQNHLARIETLPTKGRHQEVLVARLPGSDTSANHAKNAK